MACSVNDDELFKKTECGCGEKWMLEKNCRTTRLSPELVVHVIKINFTRSKMLSLFLAAVTGSACNYQLDAAWPVDLGKIPVSDLQRSAQTHMKQAQWEYNHDRITRGCLLASLSNTLYFLVLLDALIRFEIKGWRTCGPVRAYVCVFCTSPFACFSAALLSFNFHCYFFFLIIATCTSHCPVPHCTQLSVRLCNLSST